jgi:hypothetical protein
LPDSFMLMSNYKIKPRLKTGVLLILETLSSSLGIV